jgi:hypothetical protein
MIQSILNGAELLHALIVALVILRLDPNITSFAELIPKGTLSITVMSRISEFEATRTLGTGPVDI